ncbi:MFS transporter, partial [Chloroflexota bacterium]
IGFILVSIASLLLVSVKTIWMLYLFAVIFGFAQGGIGPSESPLSARLFGLKAHGLIFGVVGLGFTLGGTLGPFLTGYIFDVTNSYSRAFLICACIGIIGLIATIILKPTKDTHGQGRARSKL